MIMQCKHGNTGGVMHISCDKCRIEILEAEKARLEDALVKLLELKKHKAIHGRDKHYTEEQPKAWAAANLLVLTRYTKVGM